jgi:hypothetical protein
MGAAAVFAAGQSLDDLNIQIHGYATQGFVYTNHNNWNSMDTTQGSPAWTEAVFNVTAQPEPKLRVGVQVRYFLLGESFGNAITLDWASADYKVNDKFGIRFGKVKTPNGLFNDIQDIDPAFLWSLLPQSVYPISSRTSLLAHYGGVAYGNLPFGTHAGKLEYQLFFGERVLPENDGFFVPIQESGAYFPDGLGGLSSGGTLRWHPPVAGLMLGAALDRENTVGPVSIPAAGLSGNVIGAPFVIPYFFGKYEHDKFMFAAEHERVPIDQKTVFTIGPPGVYSLRYDKREWYAMTSYRLADKLNVGAYYSSFFDLQAPFITYPNPALYPNFSLNRYHKDWVFSARYDINSYLYLKGEQHIMKGTDIGFLDVDNTTLTNGTNMTILKLGVSF